MTLAPNGMRLPAPFRIAEVINPAVPVIKSRRVMIKSPRAFGKAKTRLLRHRGTIETGNGINTVTGLSGPFEQIARGGGDPQICWPKRVRHCDHRPDYTDSVKRYAIAVALLTVSTAHAALSIMPL